MNDLRIQLPKEMFNPAEYIRIEQDIMIEPLTSGPDTYAFTEPASVDVMITNTGKAFLIQGSIKATATTDCARCLRPAEVAIDGDVEGYVLIDGAQEDIDDIEGDEFEILGEDKTIDIMPFIVSAILLDLPRIALCDDQCKGLCPRCGCNLNEQTCACKDTDEDFSSNPFAVLKDLKL